MEINEMLRIMETDIKEVLKRADLQKIRNFMFDNNSFESYNLTYNNRHESRREIVSSIIIRRRC